MGRLMSQTPHPVAWIRRPKTPWLTALACIALALYAGQPAQAQSAKRKSAKENAEKAAEGESGKRGKAIQSKKIGNELNQANELMQQDKHQEALTRLEAISLGHANEYDKAIVLKLTGFAYYNLDRPDEAMAKIKQALDLHALDDADQTRLEFNLAQLYMQADRNQEARELLESWLSRTPEVTQQQHYTLALVYFRLEAKDKAIEHAELSLVGEETPREGWLQLAQAIYLDRDDYANAAKVVERMAALYPKKSHWVQLTALYAQLERDEEALAVLQIAYHGGFLDQDKELRRLGRACMNQDIPYTATQIFQKGLDDKKISSDSEAWELLANSWIFAREIPKAMEPMKKAAESWKNGDLYLRLAYLLVEQEDWKAAADALSKAFEKAQLSPKREGSAQLLLGMTRFNLKQIEGAESAFRRAREFADQRDAADQWLKHLDELRGKTAGG
jgi:tetratricopeptide (TPR) repeat protein